MKHFYFTLIFLIFGTILPAQNVVPYDTIIDMGIYKSYYSYKVQSGFCIYKLYKGGGNVSRKGMKFTSDLPHFSYEGSGYDKGHLVNAEDFAYDSEKELTTFKYYNCIPLTPHLNRGIWKRFENTIRKYSQTDSLIIMCGGSDYEGLIPTRCWKIAYSLTTGNLVCGVNIDQNGVIDIMTYDFIMTYTYDKIKSLYGR